MTAHGLRRLLAVLALAPTLALADPEADAPAAAGAIATGVAAAAETATLPAPLSKETVSVEAQGGGSSRDEAVAAALAEAVILHQGEQVPRQVLHDLFRQSMRDERMIRMTVVNDFRTRATRLSTAVAFVQDYQILEAVRDKKSGQWQARVNAEVVSPQARLARHQQRMDLTVLPFHFMQDEEGEIGGPDVQTQMQKTLADIGAFQKLVTQNLGGQRRIAVHELPASAGDQGSVADNPGQADWPALTRLTGASHFVTVQVEEFRMDPLELRKGVPSGRLDGKFLLHYRLIRDNDGQAEILKSGSVLLDTHHPQLKALATPGKGPVDAAEVQARVRSAYQRAARLFSDTLLGDLVPPDVVAREGDGILLRNGATPLRRGDQLAVLGPDITEADSGTGLLQREDGIRIAILEVTAVDKDRILARVVKGNAWGVQPGCLLRRLPGFSVATAP